MPGARCRPTSSRQLLQRSGRAGGRRPATSRGRAARPARPRRSTGAAHRRRCRRPRRTRRSPNPRAASAGVPIRTPELTIGGRGSKGTALRLTVMPTRCRRSSACLPSSSEARRSTSTRWTSVPPLTTPIPAARESSASRRSARMRAPSQRADLPVPERLAGGDLERHRLRRDHVLQGAALLAGEHRRVELLHQARLGVAHEDDPAARAAERLVGGRGDHVRVRQRRRVQARGDQPREVRHVHHQVGADGVGDPAELGEVEVARVGRPPGDDHPGPLLTCHPLDLGHVHAVVVLAHVVGRGPVELAGEVEPHAVGEVAAVREVEAEDPSRRGAAAPPWPRRWPARPSAAARWRTPRRTAPSGGRSPAARRRRRARSRRSSGAPDSPRRTCWSGPSPGPAITASGAKFSLAIISRVDSWRASSAEIAACTSGSVSARLPLSTGSALRCASVCTAMLISSPVRGGGLASGLVRRARRGVLGGSRRVRRPRRGAG